MSSLRRRLGVFDLTLITIGAIVGSGIFRNPAVVAQHAREPALIVGAWAAGGAIALAGAFIFAELAARRPADGGLYAYLRDAYHPLVAFMFGWTLLLMADTGGTAASAVIFSGYFPSLTGLDVNPNAIAVTALAAVTVVNCLGVRQGGTWQNAFVILKLGAIALLLLAGIVAPAHPSPATMQAAGDTALVAGFGAAMIPVLFAYNGFQGSSYVTAETRDPARTLPRGLLFGVIAVVTTYLLVNIVCLRVLGSDGLAASKAPAADVMQAAIGPAGARVIAIAVALSTLGFMSTKMLLAPRIYFQMAADGVFFKQLAWVHPVSRVPVVAIGLQGVIAAIIALSGTFAQIVTWVVATEFAFVLLAAIALFIFRARDAAQNQPRPVFVVPLHPWSTLLFIAALIAMFVAAFASYPRDTLAGFAVMAAGAVVFYAWSAARRPSSQRI
jgi:basic amino acid/polyamine antiporter, APA family